MSNSFKVPDGILDQLNEFSGGGFILYIYDQNSAPKVYAQFDTAAHGLGMQKYIQNWCSLVDTVNLETSIEELNNIEGDSSEGDSQQKT